MTSHLLEAYRADIETRTNADGNQHDFPDGYKVNAHEIRAGVVYKDANVTVTAFATKHAMESYGYRFDTPDRSIVISGDTNPRRLRSRPAGAATCSSTRSIRSNRWRSGMRGSRRSPRSIPRPSTRGAGGRAKPRLLVLHHSIAWRPGVTASRRSRSADSRDRRSIWRPVRGRPRPGCATDAKREEENVDFDRTRPCQAKPKTVDEYLAP